MIALFGLACFATGFLALVLLILILPDTEIHGSGQ